MLQIEDRLNLLCVQYLVHCLDTDNVFHHITTMDHQPMEMRDPLFTRHSQTVLPLLANSKKDELQAIHTSLVNTALDNRVLNNQHQLINDEEKCLTTAATLSRLRSGHCKL